MHDTILILTILVPYMYSSQLPPFSYLKCTYVSFFSSYLILLVSYRSLFSFSYLTHMPKSKFQRDIVLQKQHARDPVYDVKYSVLLLCSRLLPGLHTS
jgi:hypothetical protein